MLKIPWKFESEWREVEPQSFKLYQDDKYVYYNLDEEHEILKKIFEQTDYDVVYLNDEKKERPKERGFHDLDPNAQKFIEMMNNSEVQSLFTKQLFSVFAGEDSPELYRTLKAPYQK